MPFSAESYIIKETTGKERFNIVSEAQKRATEAFEKKAYDKVLVRFPKGTKERIQNLSETVNGFIVDATLEKIKEEEGLK